MTIFMSQHSHRSVPCARLKRCPQNTTLGSAYELEMPVNTARLLFTENPISAYVQSLHHCSVAQNWTRCPSGLLRFIQGTRSIWFPAEYRTFCSCHMKRGWLQHTLSIACSRSLSMCGFRDCTFFEKRKRKPRISSWKMKAATCQTARCFDINSESSSHLSG